MADNNSDPTKYLSDKEAKAPNFIERMKEEIKAVVHTSKSPHHEKEAHGRRNDIGESISVDNVKAPNVIERVKEEIEAIAQSIHHKNESPTNTTRNETSKEEPKQKGGNSSSPAESQRKEHEIFSRAKHERSPKHHKESHGTSYDIDDDTPIDSVKGPNVFQRAKEEIEAIIEAVHTKKDNHD